MYKDSKEIVWADYEKVVFDEIQNKFHDASFEFNAKVLGKYSKGERQCDIIIKELFEKEEITTLVDAKYYSRRVNVKDVESFIAMAKDIGADRGIIVSPKGYSTLAYNRAENDETRILLDILTLDEWTGFQADTAIPYSGNVGVILLSPFGWIIDGKRRDGCVAFSYRKGFSLESAGHEKEFMYFNFWKKESKKHTANYLCNLQSDNLLEIDCNAKISISEGISNGKKYILRKAIIDKYPTPEYTGIVDLGTFLFYAVLFSPENREKVNIHKLIQCICMAIPIEIKQDVG